MYYHIRYYVTIGLFINVWWCFKGLQAEQHPATADEGKFFSFVLNYIILGIGHTKICLK